MKLHRAMNEADWAQVPPAQQNIWQKQAASSRGILTPGNMFTTLGLVLVAVGLITIIHREYGAGVIALVAGRLCDLADGWAAEHSGTKSPLGELFDASVDKITTLAIIVTLAATSLISWWVLCALLLPHVLISGIALLATYRKNRIHPSRAGKLSMATAWISLIGLVILHLLHGEVAHIATGVVYLVIVVSVGFSVYAIYGYLKNQFNQSKSARPSTRPKSQHN
jgi:phosphatidylglycerophosphate synthase